MGTKERGAISRMPPDGTDSPQVIECEALHRGCKESQKFDSLSLDKLNSRLQKHKNFKSTKKKSTKNRKMQISTMAWQAPQVIKRYRGGLRQGKIKTRQNIPVIVAPQLPDDLTETSNTEGKPNKHPRKERETFPNLPNFHKTNNTTKHMGSDGRSNLNKNKTSSDPILFPFIDQPDTSKVRLTHARPRKRITRRKRNGDGNLKLPSSQKLECSVISDPSNRTGDVAHLSTANDATDASKRNDKLLWASPETTPKVPTHGALQTEYRESGLEDRPFSVRKKIEQYRKWHEKEYREKLDQFKVGNVDHRHIHASHSRGMAPLPSLSESSPNISRERKLTKIRKPKSKDAGRIPTGEGYSLTNRSPPAIIPEELLNRQKSCATWRTWRDVNDSYAYRDVKQYIKENGLMPEDKETRIKEWIGNIDQEYIAMVSADPIE